MPARHRVAATGGGTFVDPQNRAAINSDGVSVWLDVPLERAIARMPADGPRPLAADRAEFEGLFRARRDAYQLAHVRLDAGRASVDALVEQLLDWLEHRWGIWFSPTFTRTSRRSTSALPMRGREASIARSCSAISSATAPIRTPWSNGSWRSIRSPSCAAITTKWRAAWNRRKASTPWRRAPRSGRSTS